MPNSDDLSPEVEQQFFDSEYHGEPMTKELYEELSEKGYIDTLGLTEKGNSLFSRLYWERIGGRYERR